MKIDQFKDKHKRKEITIVADGLSCPQIEKTPDNIIIAVNHAYNSVVGRPDYLIFNDDYWLYEFRKSEQKFLGDIAGHIFHGMNAKPGNVKNMTMFKPKTRWCDRMVDGLYGIWSSGISAISLAIQMGASRIILYGFDYRIFTDDEAKEYFGKKQNSHASESMHRNVKEKNYINKIKYFELFKNMNVEIINCSAYSNIPYFKRWTP